MNQIDQAREVFEIRNLELRPFHVPFILGESFQPIKPFVAGIGTSGGKTFMTAGKLEFLFKYGYLKNGDRVIIFAADKTILRGNFTEQFAEFFKEVPASFSWREVTNSKEIKQAIEDEVQVLILLPQTVTHRALQLLKTQKWTWMVQDEAHRWYFKNHIQRIINNLKPKYQLLLTGTPFKFNLRKDKFIIEYVPVRKMYELGYLSNVTAQVLHSSVELNQIDYVSILGNVKESKHFTNNEVEATLYEVIKQLGNKLQVPFKKYISVNNFTKNTLKIFGKLQKTIIFTHGTQEADVVGIYFNKLGVKTLVSHSNIKGEDPNKTFEDFRTDDEVKILVAVNRGKEGFDFPELYNVVDMTYSQNFEVVMQIFGRVLRKSKNIDEKFFFKVAPKNTSGYFVGWMNAMFMLFDDEWYAKYNGKNGLDIRIPNSLLKGGNKIKSNRGNGGSSQKGKIKPRNLEFFNSLEFMKENAYFKLDDKLATVASTTLREVCIEHFKNNDWNGYKKEFMSYEDAKKIVHPLMFKSILDFYSWVKKSKPYNFPYHPDREYVNDGFNWSDFLNISIIANSNKKEYYLSYENALEFIKSKNFKSKNQFQKWRKTQTVESSAIPYHPDRSYSEFTTWSDFLGNECIDNRNKKFLSLNDFKKFLEKNNIKSSKDFLEWKKKNGKPKNIPGNPHRVYNIPMKNVFEKNVTDGRKVLCFTKDNKLVKEYKSISEASRSVGVSNTVISNCCKGSQKTSAGFIWKYKE